MNKGDNIRLTCDVAVARSGVLPKGSTGKLRGHDSEYMSSLFVTMDNGMILNLPKTYFEVYTKPKKVRNPEDFDLVGREVRYMGPAGVAHSIAVGGIAVVIEGKPLGGVRVEAAWVGVLSWMRHEYEFSGSMKSREYLRIGDMVTITRGMKNLSRIRGLKEKGNGDIVVTVLRKDGTEESFPMGEDDQVFVLRDKVKKGSLTW